MAKKRKPYERNRICSNSSTKHCHKDYVKANIDKTQQNSKCILFGDRDETINLIISECSKLAQNEYLIRWMRKVIHWN